MQQLNVKQWAILTTVAVVILGIINSIANRPAVLDTIVGAIGLVAVTLWIIIGVRRRKRRAATEPQQQNPARRSGRRRIVSVVFRDLLDTEIPDNARGYAYVWTLPNEPLHGMRVVVPGADSPAYAVIIEVDATPPSGIKLKHITRIVDQDEINKAHLESAASEAAWLDAARQAAGLPITGRKPPKVVPGHPAIAPADGYAPAANADEYGRMWWRAYKRSETAGRDPEETARFRAIAHRWFAIRDRGEE